MPHNDISDYVISIPGLPTPLTLPGHLTEDTVTRIASFVHEQIQPGKPKAGRKTIKDFIGGSRQTAPTDGRGL